MRRVHLGLAVVAAVLLTAPRARAVEVAGRRVDLALAAGALAPGTVQLAWYDSFEPASTFEIATPTTLLLSAFFDVGVAPRLSLGGRINTVNLRVDRAVDLGYYDFDGTVHVLEPGDVRVVEFMVSGKYAFDVAPRVRLRPAIYLGWVQTFANDPDARSHGAGLNAALEALYQLDGPAFLFGEVGLVSQVYGGVTHVGYTRTKGPILSFAVGAGF